MIKKISPVLILASMVVSNISQAQDAVDKLMPKTIMASPNVAGLGKYGDYPISQFTGVPEILIPVFEAKSGSLSVPITLSYHASGIRYTDQASWVGLGWSLSTGGQISRSTAGGADELGYINNTILLNPSVCNNFNYLRNVIWGSNDIEPDLFSYVYPGKSGKFMLGQGGQPPYLIPYEPIQVTPYLIPNHIPKIEITGEDGVLYRFGQNAAGTSATEYTSTTNGNTTTNFEAMTAWHLMEMISPNANDKISFDYQNYGPFSLHDISESYTVADLASTLPLYTPPAVNITGSIKDNNVFIGSQQGIHTITFEGGKVDFILGADRTDSQASKQLDSIKIYSITNGVPTLIKSVKFVYSYFTGINSLSSSNLRLKLDQVLFLDNTGLITQQYKFTYFTNTFSWSAPTNSSSRDYWGFYNGFNDGTGGNSTSGLVPFTVIPYQATDIGSPGTMTVGNSNRSANPAYLTEGMLKRIDRETGGYTIFDFEPHQYFESSTAKIAGGVRVSKITSYDGSGASPLVKTYKYGNPTDGLESGYGFKNFDLNKFFFMAENTVINLPYSDLSPGTVHQHYRSRIYLSNSSLSIYGNDGSPVLYPNVTEYYGDNTSNIGKITYEFDGGFPPMDNFQFLLHSTRSYRNSASWERGKLTTKVVYDQLGHKLTKSRSTYTFYKSDNRIVGALVGESILHIGDQSAQGNGGCLNEQGIWVFGDEYVNQVYSQMTGAFRKTSSTDSLYENGNTAKFVRKQSDQTFDPDKLQVVLSKENKSSSPEENVAIIKYPFSYGTISSAATGNAKALRTLQLKNVLVTPVETYHYIQNSDGSNQRMVSGQVTTFKENPANTNYVVADQASLLEIPTGAPLSLASYVPSSINGASTGMTLDTRYQSRANFTNYDSDGNLLDLARSNDNPTAYVWGYSNTMPIAEVINANAAAIRHSSFEDDGTLNAEVRTGKKVWSGTYTFALPTPLGTYTLSFWQKSASPGGPWVYNTQAVTVTGVNAGTNMTISAGGLIIDEFRFAPSTAMMTTYTYDPVLGITTTTDPANSTTYYRYDNFGRLLFVKDTNGKILKSYGYHYNGTQP